MQDVHAEVLARVADGLDGFQRAAADEHRQSPEQLLVCRREQVVAPGDRATQRLLALRRSRAPPVSSSSRRSRRACSSFGGRSLTRAAASSIASGSPSNCRQISTTACAFLAVSAKSGRTAAAR